MGIFGLISNDEAIDYLIKSMDLIYNQTQDAIVEIGKTKNSINGTPGDQIIYSIISKAEKEIPDYIYEAGLNIRSDYPYGDPTKFVMCAIVYKYANAYNDDKKLLSKKIKNAKNGVLISDIQDIVKTYCDNMEKSLVKLKQFDRDKKKQKETAIRLLTDNFQFYDEMFIQRENDNGNSRKRK